ncbi:MAG: ribonuclease P protein component [Bacilli bacterium]|nr:ribonuclease P protein component [Bacilli bacterium]
MKKINIVKNNEEFNLIMNKGKILKNKYFVLYFMNNNLDKYRFGISVGKKVCNAVNRNKLKRQVRNILDYHKNLYSKSKDYIIIVRKSSLNEKYSILEENLVNLLEKAEE